MSERSGKAVVDDRRRGDSDKKMVVRGNRDAMPALAQIGIAIAIFVAGFVASQLRPRERSPPRPTSHQTPSSGSVHSFMFSSRFNPARYPTMRVIGEAVLN